MSARKPRKRAAKAKRPSTHLIKAAPDLLQCARYGANLLHLHGYQHVNKGNFFMMARVGLEALERFSSVLASAKGRK